MAYRNKDSIVWLNLSNCKTYSKYACNMMTWLNTGDCTCATTCSDQENVPRRIRFSILRIIKVVSKVEKTARWNRVISKKINMDACRLQDDKDNRNIEHTGGPSMLGIRSHQPNNCSTVGSSCSQHELRQQLSLRRCLRNFFTIK